MEFVSNKYLDINDLTKALVISYDNEITNETNRFISTLEKHEWDYMIVGKGEIWKGFINRVIKYNEILKTLPPNKIVILSDARDVYCCRCPKAFIDAFNSFNTNTIISAELFLESKMDWTDEELKVKTFQQGIPINNYWKYHNITNLPNRKYVNCGLIAGKAADLIHQTSYIIDFSNKNNTTDDQFCLTHYINEFPDKTAVDSDATLLHTSTFGVNAGIQNVHIQKLDSPTFAELFGRSAFFLHIPGSKIKGQRLLYEYCWKIIETGICSEKLLNLYNYHEISWNENF
jgi:hypothetical protein